MMDITLWSLMLLALASVTGVLYALWQLGVALSQPRGPNVSQRLSDLEHARVKPVQWQLLRQGSTRQPAWLIWLLNAWPGLRQLERLSPRQMRRRRQIEAQLPDALDLIARAMQAGHALSSAVLLAASEGPEPLASEWQTIFDQINFGIPTRVAIEAFAERVGSDDVRLFVVSILVQMETGGNMADILKNTADLIRQREQLRASVKVLSAEGRISALILSVLPFGLAALLTLINPGFISVLWTDPLGVRLLLGALALMLAGIVWMWRMIDIPV